MTTVRSVERGKTKKIKFCPHCGGDKFVQRDEKKWQCVECNFIYYHNAAAAVVAVFKYGDELLLTVRKHSPGQGMLDLPGGFVDFHETFEQALTREIQEELNFNVATDEWGYLFSLPNRYDYAGIIYHTADVFFVRELDYKPAFQASDDVAAIVWKRLQDIDLKRVGLVSIRNAIAYIQSE